MKRIVLKVGTKIGILFPNQPAWNPVFISAQKEYNSLVAVCLGGMVLVASALLLLYLVVKRRRRFSIDSLERGATGPKNKFDYKPINMTTMKRPIFRFMGPKDEDMERGYGYENQNKVIQYFSKKYANFCLVLIRLGCAISWTVCCACKRSTSARLSVSSSRHKSLCGYIWAESRATPASTVPRRHGPWSAARSTIVCPWRHRRQRCNRWPGATV